jgi:hypothetical protein
VKKGKDSRPDPIMHVTAAIHNWLARLDDDEYSRVMRDADKRKWKRTYKSSNDKYQIERYYRE